MDENKKNYFKKLLLEIEIEKAELELKLRIVEIRKNEALKILKREEEGK